jgi:hypothetical protein
MAKWEYLVVHIEGSKVAEDQPEFDNYLDADKYTEALNRYGTAGWELVNFESLGHAARAAFKRQKAEDEMPTHFREWVSTDVEIQTDDEIEG